MADDNMAGKSTFRWTDSATSLLLESLRSRESLWNSKVDSYRDRNKKKTEQEEIIQLLRDEVPDIDLPTLKSKLEDCVSL